MSWPMFELACSVEPGLFANECLIRFQDWAGEPQSAFVNCGLVHRRGASDYLVVRGFLEADSALVSLPSDGSRVRVPATAVTVIPG